MTYIWQIPDDHPEEMIAVYDRKRSPDRFLFRKAQPLPVGIGPAYLSIKREMPDVLSWDCLPNTTMLPLVNPDVGHLLTEHADKDMQLVDTVVETSTGTVTDFKLLSPRASVLAVDASMSEFSLVPGTDKIMKFSRLVLRPNCLGDHVLALASEYRSYLLVADAIAEKLRTRTGIQLTRPEDIHK